MLERARQDTPDLLVLDVMLPGTSGFEICRRVRADAHLYTLPILIVSAMRGEEEVMHGLAQGADDYVVKPFEPAQVVQRVEALLRVSGNNLTDSLTGMPGVDAIRREIQKRISLREIFGFAYVELLHIRPFGFKYGAEPRDKAIRHLSRALAKCGEDTAPEQHFIGHMGNGHYVCILPPAKVQDFCDRTWKLWSAHIEDFYKSIGQEAAYRNAIAQSGTGGMRTGVPLLDVLCCLTVHDRRPNATPQKLFEVLSQIRHKALAQHRGGVFVDQRI